MRMRTDSAIKINVLNALGGETDGGPAGESENEPLRFDFDRQLLPKVVFGI
jgi:hypothetical protein